MDRRSFVKASIAGLLTCSCSLARARADSTLHGCRMAGSAGQPLGLTLREHGPGVIGNHLDFHKKSLIDRFGIRPGVSFYDDGNQHNALAYHMAYLPDGPDGTVLLGYNWFERLDNLVVEPPKANKPHPYNFIMIPITIMAHEFGHIMQYKNGMTPAGPWQMEPHADFLAGWAYAKLPGADIRSTGCPTAADPCDDITPELSLEATVKAFFELGDNRFNDRGHHGEPEFRAAMVRAGYESRDLNVKEAFEKGKKFAGLT